MNIEDKIRLFTELPGDERRDVERYVEAHGDEQPQLKALLQQSKRLEQLFESARRLETEPPDEEAIAFFAVMREVDRERMPSDLSNLFERLETRIDEDPDLQELLRKYEGRGAELARASDPEAQFARLSGEAVSQPGDTWTGTEGDRVDGPAADAMDEAKSDRDRAPGRTDRSRARTETDRSRRSRTRTDRSPSRVLRRGAAVALAAAAVYALLFVGGRSMQPEHERLARFSSEELQLSGYSDVRGDQDSVPDSAAAAYIQALAYLRDSETSFLGLFPGYRQAPLDSAAVLLQEVIAREPDDSFLSDEAHYFLGKTELARGNVEEARSALQRVAQSPGMRAGEARSLIDQMQGE